MIRRIIWIWILWVAATFSGRAQLADTIWEGYTTVSNLSLQPCVDGIPKSDLTIQGLKVQVPFEIWFLDNENLLVVGRRDKNGGDPTNQKYLLFWGEFPGNESNSTVHRGIYARGRSAGSYSFNCDRTRVGASSSWTYSGARSSMSGTFVLKMELFPLRKRAILKRRILTARRVQNYWGRRNSRFAND
jgi:hypothetical protein